MKIEAPLLKTVNWKYHFVSKNTHNRLNNRNCILIQIEVYQQKRFGVSFKSFNTESRDALESSNSESRDGGTWFLNTVTVVKRRILMIHVPSFLVRNLMLGIIFTT